LRPVLQVKTRDKQEIKPCGRLADIAERESGICFRMICDGDGSFQYQMEEKQEKSGIKNLHKHLRIIATGA